MGKKQKRMRQSMNNSFELLTALIKAGYIKGDREELWWPKSGSFEVIAGAVLTQQTKWEKVEKALENLRLRDSLSLEAITVMDIATLALLIKPSGFYNTKAKNLHRLCVNITEDFGDFENFANSVDREWLLSQKGIGPESADCILCYACKKEIMVVDSYTNRLLSAYGYEFESYDDLQEWMMQGIVENFSEVQKLYQKEISLLEVYARFHGKIVEFCKENMRGKRVDLDVLKA